jgi:WD40 repeat protein
MVGWNLVRGLLLAFVLFGSSSSQRYHQLIVFLRVWTFQIQYSADKTIKLWDARTGDFQKTLASHSNSVNAVAFSPDGQQIVSGSADTTIKLWDARIGDLQKTLAGHSSSVYSVAFSPDGQRRAVRLL